MEPVRFSPSSDFPSFPLADLHAHLGASIHPSIYWQIAHDQGFKLPKKQYHEFLDYITISEDKPKTINEYFKEIYHPLLDPLSSGTYAVERATYEIMSGAYRANYIKLIELRNNPMKHNDGGTVDVDHVIMAMLRGMERALLEYTDLSAGLIFCLAREFPYELNEIIVEKAIKYQRRGVVGIDFAGPKSNGFHFKDYTNLMLKAKKAGLKITSHSGELKEVNDMWDAVEFIHPTRIGHGIQSAYDPSLMKQLVKSNIVLEVCPMSNIATKAVENEEELRFILRKLVEHKVLFTINTDWPEMIEHAHLRSQYQYLKEQQMLTEDELKRCSKIAFASTFVPKGGLTAYL